MDDLKSKLQWCNGMVLLSDTEIGGEEQRKRSFNLSLFILISCLFSLILILLFYLTHAHTHTHS